ncbi:MAG: PIN domain-containing protein [Chloroflexi bacterium]|nr:PIN domain-containing protein [Chloroflexota bacterium]
MAELKPALTGHTLIGLDTNPFIYLFERNTTYFSLVESLFEYLKQPGVQGVTSIITLIETCVQPQREGRTDLVQIYEQALLNSRQVQTLSINPVLARRAVELRVKYHLRVPDALQVSAALESGATLFVTNDSRLRKITELSLLILDDFIM